MSDARDRWLDEGLTVLEADGAAGVRIDRIAARLGLSKGSFHHHFQGADGFKRDLLAHFERLTIETLESAISEAGDPGDARGILSHLTELVRPSSGFYRPRLEVAVRAWATWDAEVGAVQARIDAARLGALQRVWRPHVDSDDAARAAALLPYLIGVGATVIVPPVEAQELQDVYRILLPLVPEVLGD
ncbi:TetR/AcrR family transcriptional regulator [Homoserinimonas sp. A447]